MNHFIFTLLNGLTGHSGFFDASVIFIARFGIYVALVSAFGFFTFLFLVRDDWKGRGRNILARECLVIAATVLSAVASTVVLKAVFHEARPFIADPGVHPLFAYGQNDSFPSGHAALLYAFAMAVTLYHRRTGWIFFIFAILVSVCRVISGIHFPIDIMAGGILGSATAYGAHRLLAKKYGKK